MKTKVISFLLATLVVVTTTVCKPVNASTIEPNSQTVDNIDSNQSSTKTIYNSSVDRDSSTVYLRVKDNSTQIVDFVKYDLENEIISISGVNNYDIKFTTEVVDLHPSVDKTYDQVLQENKQNILNSYDISSSASRSCDVDSWIPSNASYIDYATYKVNFAEQYKNLGAAMEDFGYYTTIAALGASLAGFAPGLLIADVAGKIALTGTTMRKAYGYVQADWYYKQQRTSSQYRIGYITDYAYRYAQSHLSQRIKVNGKTYFPSTYTSTKGNWWTTRKPW